MTTGPILLTGLAVCATCNGGMTLRIGTSKTGAVHRYYTCSTCAQKGKTVCNGRSIPIAKLDTLVTTHMSERLFQPERMAMILSSLSSRRSEKEDAVKSHSSQAIQIDPALLEQFGRSMRENFTSGSISFRKAYLKS